MFKWFIESNRWKHFVGGTVLGFLFTFFCALGAAGGMEYKDYAWGGVYDWLDFIATCSGGVIGQVLQLLVLRCIGII